MLFTRCCGIEKRRRQLVRAMTVWLSSLACAIAAGASPALAVTGQFGESGDEAGQFIEPQGLAIDQGSGDVYVVDKNNQRVEKWDGTGRFLLAWGWGVADGFTEALQTCTSTCFTGTQGVGVGQFDFPDGGDAVDNSNLLGEVYVVDSRNKRVEKFNSAGEFELMFGGEVNETSKGDVCLVGEKCKAGEAGTENGQFNIGQRAGDYVAVGAAGTVYVGDENRVQEFSPEGAYQSQVALPSEAGKEPGATTGLVVDSTGDLYVISAEFNEGEGFTEGLSGVRKYDSSGKLLEVLDAKGGPKAVTLDASDNLYIDDEGVSGHRILEYNASGKEISVLDADAEGGERGIAFSDVAKQLYVLSTDHVRVVVPSVGPLVESESATSVGRTEATLNATVNPEGQEESSSEALTYHFEYGETAAYSASTATETSTGGSFEDRQLSAQLTGLQPRTTYHFRVVATNAAHETIEGPDDTFPTLPPTSIDSESASDVTSSSATLAAQINPLGSDTKFRFEYDTTPYAGSAEHGKKVPLPEGDVGSGESDVAVAEHVQGLEPDTVYHYRVVAVNGLGTVDGPDHGITTQSVESVAALPDGRRWELVSPPDKRGATIQSFDLDGAVIQASESGGAITYAANAPTEATPPANIGPEREQVLSTRTAEGWESRDIATPHSVPTAENQTGHETEYQLFSGDLSFGAVEPVGETQLSPEASEPTPYRRDNTDNTYQPLVTAANSLGAKFGKQIEFIGATPDLSHIVVESSVALTAPPSGAGIYEWASGKLQLASVLPDKTPATEAHLGNEGRVESGIVRHAMSNDGSRVVWDAEGHLYMRDMGTEETVRLDTVESGAQGGFGGPRFQTASGDESEVFFTSNQRLTVGAKGETDLYEFGSTGSGLAGKLTDLTADPNPGEHGSVEGVVMGASEDGSYVYVVDSGALTAVENSQGEKAAPGSNNLYLLHENGMTWTTTFVAQLAGEDRTDWEATGAKKELIELTSRVSPNGRWLAFMSNRSLSGYDSTDANPEAQGARDEEVFLYDAGSNRLTCTSCNPSGQRPAGLFDSGQVPIPLVDEPQIWGGRWLAGLVPGWTPVALHHALYQSRYLSDSGRLFFDSPEALVPQDTNAKMDVYEYEPADVGSCGHDSGCVALISSGSSGEESAFLDASESGGDVFFLTAAKLAPRDYDTSLDVYDAHECASPCPPVAAAQPPPCTTEASCKPSPTPPPAIFGSPPSATFSGAGNVAPEVVPPPKRVTNKAVKCKRGFVKSKKKKGKCVRQKRKARAKRAGRDRRGNR